MVQEIQVDQLIQLFMKQRICLVMLIHTGMENYPTLDTWLEETIAETLEDFVLQGDVINSFNYTESDNADATGHGYVTYCHSDSYYGLIDWNGSATNCSYSLGSTFGSFMNRRYPE